MDKERHSFSYKRLQSILQLTHTLLFEFDPITNDLWICPAIKHSNQETINLKRLCDEGIVHPNDATKAKQFNRRIVKIPAMQSLNLRFLSEDGDYRWHRILVSRVTSIDGHPIIVGSIVDIDEEMRLREFLRYKAEFHETSGIYNKHKFYSETKNLLTNNIDGSFSIIYFDIDHFKAVNEIYTYAEGDHVLRYIGTLLKGLLHVNETYGHISNDNFCMCVHRQKFEIEHLIIEIQAKLKEYPLDFDFVISAGILIIDKYNDEPVSALCDLAILAKQTRKGNFMHRFAYYESWMSRAFNYEHSLMKDINIGLEHNEFTAYFQTKHDMKTDKVVSAEALVRWNHPGHGVISPGEFIPLLERSGMIILLDEYIWEYVCKTLRRWLDSDITPIPVSVNISRVYMHNIDLCKRLKQLLSKYDIPLNLFLLELTESAHGEVDNMDELIQNLKDNGFTVLMDDFGSGYSSLNMLKSLPIDVLKIDLKFLSSSGSKSKGEIILKSIINMAGELGIKTIVEGVETAEQATFLQGTGCDMAQGYFYSRPMPVEDLEAKFLNTELN